MKKYAVVLEAVVLLIFTSLVSVFSSDIIWDDIGRGNLDLRTVLVNTDNLKIIYVGSSNGVLKSEDGGGSWRNILSVRGQNKAVNFLLFEPKDKNSLYAATGNGLFYSTNQGRDWGRIFKGKSSLENECTTLAVFPSTIYLGTKAGLFESLDKGRTWHKETGKVGSSHILAITYTLKEPSYIYAASVDGVFKTQDAGQSWERIFVIHPVEDGNDIEEEPENQDEKQRNSNIRHISIDPNNANDLYLATSRGIFKSNDQGKTWQDFPGYGLLSQDVKFLLMSDGLGLFALTKSSIYKYGNQRWQEISLGLASADIRFIALDKQYNLYAACDKGLFKTGGERDNATNADTLSLYLKGEPDIRKVQEAAIEYAEVHPDKIKSWRKQAARKTILPQLSTGIGRNVTDLWHWETGSTTKSEDDVLRKGRDAIEWDITLSWDLSELIWNNDQTSIDSRSKLMSELRDNILDEVTRIYFERIRLKMELDNLKIEDQKKRLEKELRLRELAASLDGLTGGYFSSQIKKKL